jgi:hypothetical protein
MSEKNERRRWVTPGTVLGGLALAVASIQPAQAVAQRLGAHTVGTRELKSGAVTSAKVRDGSLTRADLASSARPRLPRSYADGEPGQVYPPSTPIPVVSFTLPAGTWVVSGKARVMTYGAGWAECSLDNGGTLDSAMASPSNAGQTVHSSLVAEARVTQSAAHLVALRCVGADAALSDVKLLAVEVG